MRTGRIITGIIAAMAAYLISLNQTAIFGRVLIFDEKYVYAFITSILLFFILSAFDRTKNVSYLILPAAVIILSDILLSSAIIFMPALSPYYATLKDAEIYLLLLITSIISSILKYTENIRVQAAISFISLIIASVSSYLLILSFPSLPHELAFVTLAFLSVLALTSLANISEKLAFLRDQRVFLLSIVAAISIYLTILKPLIGERIGIANFIEWIIVFLAVIKIARSVTRVESDYESAIHVHRVEERAVKDEFHEKMEFAEKMFIEKGIKEYLIAAISSSADLKMEKIADIISPIIRHRDERVPVLSFPWEKKIVEMRNRKRRKEVLREVKEKLAGGV